jgi:hypothetical protein
MFCSKQVMIGASKNIWGFDPRTIPGCVVWLDAADTSTLTLSGSNITALRDKSGLSNNVNSISATAPTYNSADSSINFTATSGTFLRGAISQTNSNASVFVVASIITQTTPFIPRLSMLGSSATSNSTVIGQLLVVDVGNPRVYTYLSTNTNPSGQGTNIMTLVSNVTYGTRQVITNVSTFQNTVYTISTFLNGDAQTTSVSTRTGTFSASGGNVATYNKYSIGNYLDSIASNGDAYNGKIFEYLVFNNALTLAQCQQVEGYLTWKWGIQTSMPTTQPYRSFKPDLQYFQPNNIAGLSVWFDAADTNTITGSNPVTAWRDKSGNRWNATTLIGTAPTLTTVNGNTAVSFAGSSTLTVSNVSFSIVQPRAIFVVYRIVTSTPNYISFFSTQWSGGNNQGGHNNLTYSTGGGAFLQSFAVGGAVRAVNTSLTPNTLGTTAQIAYIHSATSTANNFITQNGTSYTLNSADQTASGYSTLTINYYIGNAYPQPYILCEYILYQREFTIAERQQVEAYLAWKWGITSSLPATHPYKTIPTALIIPPVVDALTNSGSSDVFVVKYDSSGRPLWARRMGGTGGDIGYSVSTDSSGNIVVAGYYGSPTLNIFATNGTTVSFALTNSGSAGSLDAFVVKYDPSGTPLWARRMGGTGSDQVLSVTTDSSGNVIVAGYYNSNPLNIYAANGSTVLFTLNSSGGNDALVVKYDSSGTPLWARRLGGTGDDRGNSVRTDSSGNIVVSGPYNSATLNIFAANGIAVSFTLSNSGNQDTFVVKYDSSGTLLWARRIGGTSFDEPRSVSIDSSGNVIVAGYYGSGTLNIFAANGSTVSFTLPQTSGASVGTSDDFIVKYDSSGTPLWARRIGGTVSENPYSVSTDSSGNIVVAGYYESNPLNIFAANGSTVSFTLANSGSDGFTDAFVVKYDSSGTPLWARRMGGTGQDIARSVSTDSSGNILVAGYYSSNPLNIFAADGTTVSFTLANFAGSSYMSIINYDSSGTPLWARRIGGTSGDLALSVSTDSSQNIVMAGYYNANPLSFYG